MITPIPSDWITVVQAVKISGYHPDYLRTLLRTKQIQGIKIASAWLVSRSSLEDFLRKSRLLGEKRGPK